MHCCPHCRSEGIALFQKWNATLLDPATCSHCQQYSYAPSTARARVGIVLFLMLLAAAGLSWTLQSIPMAALGALLSLLVYIQLWQNLPLQATGCTNPCPDKTSLAWIGLDVIGVVAAAATS